MELKAGDILVKNDVKNEYTKRFDINEGDKFKFLSKRSKTYSTLRVICIKNGTVYTMYASHFKDSNGKFILDCMWR